MQIYAKLAGSVLMDSRGSTQLNSTDFLINYSFVEMRKKEKTRKKVKWFLGVVKWNMVINTLKRFDNF